MRIKEQEEEEESADEDDDNQLDDDLDFTKDIHPTSAVSQRCLIASCTKIASHRCCVCSRSVCSTHAIAISADTGSAEKYYACGPNHVIPYDVAMAKARGIFLH
jgi:hypothetical protein